MNDPGPGTYAEPVSPVCVLAQMRAYYQISYVFDQNWRFFFKSAIFSSCCTGTNPILRKTLPRTRLPCTGTDENEKLLSNQLCFFTKIGVFSLNQLYFHYECTDENSALGHSLVAYVSGWLLLFLLLLGVDPFDDFRHLKILEKITLLPRCCVYGCGEELEPCGEKDFFTVTKLV